MRSPKSGLLPARRFPSTTRLGLATTTLLLLLTGSAQAATITVTTTTDDQTPNDGSVSLREAITAIDSASNLGDPDITAQNPGTFGVNDTINFAIPQPFGAPVRQTILVGSTGNGALPAVTKPVTINGYSESGASANTLANADNAVAEIALDGANAGPNADGLLFLATSAGSRLEGLDVFDFSLNQVELQSGGDVLAGNDVGFDTTGSPTRSPTGVHISNASGDTIGGTTAAARNMISGNVGSGVEIVGTLGAPATGNIVEGDFIGTDPTGESADGNGRFPPYVDIGAVQVNGGNSNTIGGATAAARNVISGNGSGVDIRNGGENNVVQGNFIGVAADGVNALPNSAFGVHVGSDDNLAPPAGPGQANEPAASGNVVGLSPVTLGGLGNVIAFNGGDGVLVAGTPQNNATQAENSGNSVLGNAIYSNGALGIDLQEVMPFPKPNNVLKAPTISEVTPGASSTAVRGTMNLPGSPGMTLRIELFSSPNCAPNGNGQGQIFIGFATTTTDASGNANFSANVSRVSPGQSVTATATNTTPDPSAPAGSVNLYNTSEFSRCFTLPIPPLVTPSNAFTVVSKSARRGVITLKIQTHAAGKLSASATFLEAVRRFAGRGHHRHARTVHKTITYGQASASTAGAPTTVLTIAPTSTAAHLLAKLRTLHLSIKLSFSPTGAQTNTSVLSFTVSAPKSKPKPHRRRHS